MVSDIIAGCVVLALGGEDNYLVVALEHAEQTATAVGI